STIAPNNTNIVAVNVTVPQTYEAGNYTGTVNVSAADNGYDTFVLNVSVPENRSWSRTPSSYVGVEVADEGTVCVINISNTGNAPINISISPSGINYTSLNETNFTLQYDETRYVLVSYNITLPGKGYYDALYTISAQTPDTTPENMTVNISIVPYIEPTMSGSVSSVSLGQNNSVELNVNVTDQSTSGINWTVANVTAPDGTIFTSGNMTYEGTIGNTTVWVATFPDDFNPVNASMDSPTTNQRGQYNVSIKTADNTGALGTMASQFNVHRNLTISMNATAAKYPEGDAQCTDGTIDYVVYDTWNSTDIDMNVSIEIQKDNELWFERTTHEIVLNERIRRIFPICVSDVGSYTAISETVFYDDISNETVTIRRNATFEVYSIPITLDIINPSFDDTRIAFRVWVKDIFGAYIAPDEM
ncbi:MAG: hypothetical protein KAJ24_05400, partial [Candidatus Aenigmarchaeota archaeon]|nr:hypothetical protein [Candidatus Aenigmarchaeota archaeon]